MACGARPGREHPRDLGDRPVDLLADRTSSCREIERWPGVLPTGGVDANGRTFAESGDSNGVVFQALALEVRPTSNAFPLRATYSASTKYRDCTICALLYSCTPAGCTPQYFAQSGSVTVHRADPDHIRGQLHADATALQFVEWNFAADLPIGSTACVAIARAEFRVGWNRQSASDGGTTDFGRARDMGIARDLRLSARDLRLADLEPPSCSPVINEVMTASSLASDEFIELYNPCSSIDARNWRLVYRSASNNGGTIHPDSTLHLFHGPLAVGYTVIGGVSFPIKDGELLAGLAPSGGAVGLRNSVDDLVDSVAYDTLNDTNNFTEGLPAPNPPAGQSIARRFSGVDTDNNRRDFRVGRPTPRAPNL